MKDDLLYVGHMFDMAKTAQSFVIGRTIDDFYNDLKFQLALLHALQIIGEAARHVSEPFRDQHPQIPWRTIVGFRHRVVHDYLNIEHRIVWEIATTELQPLIEQLSAILPSDPPP